MLVVDASIVVALISGHPATAEVTDVLRDDPHILAPAHLDAEVLAAFRGRHLGGHLTREELATVADGLASLPVGRVPLDDRDLLRTATRWFGQLTAYDALYLALAALTGGVVLTGDRGMARSAAATSVAHRHVDCSA
ncbi:MAG: type II toxin-antitoxin system VapC family toxin [Kineosporiaceae bacterium]